MKSLLLKSFFGTFFSLVLIVFGAHAADQVVTSKADSGSGSLRQAIADVGAGETITFNLSAGNETIILTSDELLIDKSLTIDGANTAGSGVQVTVQVPVPGTTPYRVFHIQVAGTVTISNLIMKGGINNDAFAAGGGVIYSEDGSGGTSGNVTLNLNNVTVESGKSNGVLASGGGVYYDGNLSIQNSLFQNNGSLNSLEQGVGGGICSGENAVNLSVVNSTFKNNLSISGGAIYLEEGTATVSGCTFEDNNGGQNNVLLRGGGIVASSEGNSIVIENSTFYNNSSSGEGGAIAAYSGANVTVNSCTIFNNHATGEPGTPADAGGIYVANTSGVSSPTTLTLRNNIIYGNTASSNSDKDIHRRSGTVTNQGHNIWEDGNISSVTGDITFGFANLFGTGQNTQTLANNGGPTQTLAILPGSIAIGAGNTALTTDQRGYTRGTPTTIGAFAFDGTPPTPPSAPVHPGGVAGENLWLKANDGVTNSGSNLTGWTDKTGTNTFSVTGTPTYTAQGINFNPKVSFNNTQAVTAQPGSYLDGNTSLPVVSGFAVYKSTDAGSGALVGSTTSPDQYGVQYFGGFGANQFWAGNGSLNQTLNYSDPKLSTTSPAAILEMSYAAGNATTSRLNGGNKTLNFGSSTITGYNFTPRIGGTNNQGGTPSLGWSHFRGDVAEIVLYPTNLSTADKLKVESYLAIKYGIMLDQSVTNYVASDGTTLLWSNTTYWHDVFGIGKDDASGLNQASSNSINTGSGDGTGQSGKGNVVLSNASSLADGDFLLMGHDNGTLTEQTTEVPTVGMKRMAREWLVKRTGDPGTVDLSFDILGLTLSGTTAADFKLLVDADGDFSSGATVVDAASLTGTKVAFTGVNIPDGSYLTIVTQSAPQFGPGVFGSSLWFMASEITINANTFELKNLGGLTSVPHASQSTTSKHPTPVTSGTDAFNFNAGLTFGGDDQLVTSSFPVIFGGTNGDEDLTQFVVYRNKNNQILVYESEGFGLERVKFTSQGNFRQQKMTILPSSDVGANQIALMELAGTSNLSGSSNFELRKNGLSGQTVSGTYQNNNNNLPFKIAPGNISNGGAPIFDLAEIILYPARLSEEDLKKVRSYLAIKYGISLDPSVMNYVSSAGTVLWNNITYWHDVFGIGKDDASRLYQASSNSINTGSGDGTGQSGKGNIVLSNASSLDNGDFLLIGHDNQPAAELSLTNSNADLPPSLQNKGILRLAREWKVIHTGNVGTLDMTIDLAGITVTGAIGTDINDFKLLVDLDGDGDFTTGTVDVISPVGFGSPKLVFDNISLPNNAVLAVVTDFSGTILPVRLLQFSGTIITECEAQINWTLADEVDMLGYELQQRNRLSGPWEKVSFYSALNANSGIQRRQYKTILNVDSNYYYRLKLIEKNGQSSYSKEVFLRCNKGNGLKLFPNPTTGWLYIQGLTVGSVYQIIEAASGKVVHHLIPTSSTSAINVGPYQKGMYYLVENGEEGPRKIGTINKQ